MRYSFFLMMILLAGLAFADNPAGDARLELRHRLDSIEVEKQARKRQGLGIEDLEAASAELRDSLSSMRVHVPRTAGGEAAAKEGFALPWKIPYLEGVLSFKPNSVFDWIVAGTGLVAILSGLMLVVGIIVSRKKKPAERRKEKVVSRKINLAPTGTHPVVPGPGTFDRVVDDSAADILPRAVIPATGRTYDFGSRMSDQRRAAYGSNELAGNAKGEERDPTPELQSLLENLRKVAPPPPAPPSPPEQPPLVVSAPEPQAFAEPDARPAGPPGTGPLADRLSWAAPPSGGTGAGTPAFNELVIAASKNGLSEPEISKRYQLSVDQVRLILRMNK